MKKEGIQTRKRKPKNHSGIAANLPGPSGIHKTEIKSSLLGESSVSKSIIQFISTNNLPFRIALPKLLMFCLIQQTVWLNLVASIGILNGFNQNLSSKIEQTIC